mmetsp:Transcript_30206/g.85326  ORF Transcript_30206/g.85326 Transcript_30206/m.85326 type:complete len:434 (+) Transcript_30206:932-2233(+)
MDAQLQVLAECLVELVEVILVLRNLIEQLQALLHNVLLDHLQNLVLLQHLTRNVEGQVLAVHNALHKAKVLRDQVLAVVHDEHSAHIQLQVVLRLLVVEHVKRSTLGDEQDALELQLALHREVLPPQGLLPVVGQALVERSILILRDLLRVTHPDGLLLVEQVPLMSHLLHSLLFLLLSLLVHLLNLTLLLLILLLLGLLVVVVVHLLVDSLLGPPADGVADELAVLLHQVLHTALLQVLGLVLLHVQDNLGATPQRLALGVAGHGEAAASLALPNVLLVVVVLGGHDHLVGHQVGAVETDAELPNHADVGAGGQGLHEGLGPGPRNGAKVVHQVGLSHADAAVDQRQSTVLLVGNNVDEQLGLGLQLALVGEPLKADLVEGIGGVRDELAQEDLLVAVEGVDNQGEQLVDLRLESKGLSLRHGCNLGSVGFR